MSEKCYQLFLSGICAEKTRDKYEYYLKRFLKETKLKNFSALIELDDETRQDIIERYILLLKSNGLKRTSVRLGRKYTINVNKKNYSKNKPYLQSRTFLLLCIFFYFCKNERLISSTYCS